MEEERAHQDSTGHSSHSDGLALADYLYILKQSLVVDGQCSRHARRQLREILAILEREPFLAYNLYNWNFLTRELLYALREPSTTAISIQAITRVISVVRKLPDFFLTKKFLFFVTERLYAVLKSKRGGALVSTPHPVTERDVLLLVTELISIDRTILNVLWEVGFFTLANALPLSLECCVLYNAVFINLYHYTVLDHLEQREYSPEVFFEIQRHYFDVEIVFKEKEIIELKRHMISYNRGIYEKIYQKCGNLRYIIDLSVKDTLDLMLYKRIVFMNDDLDLLIREKNPKAIRFYRRSLEEGAVPSMDYFIPLTQMLDDAGSRMDAAVALYYVMPSVVDFRGFTEPRIRSIFECLEYHCEPECDARLRRLEYERMRMELKRQTAVQPGDISFDSNILQEVSYFDFSCSNAGTKADTPLHDTHGFASILDSFESPADISSLPPARPIATSLASTGSAQEPLSEPEPNIDRCNRLRIVRLIKGLYGNVDRTYFYKPSYLILMRSQMGHCPSELGFINNYFTDFLDYTVSGRTALARTLFPVQAQKRARRAVEKNREVLSGLGLLDGARDAAMPPGDVAAWDMYDTDEDENIPAFSALRDKLEKMVSTSNKASVAKRAKNTILSESEDEGSRHIV